MRLLVITQKIDQDDYNLGFFHRWLLEMSREFKSLEVVALGLGTYALPGNISVYSLGKERGRGRLRKLLAFYRLIFKLRNKYDAVFVHMNPEYAVMAGWYWKICGKPVYLWYVHKSVTWWLGLAERWVKKIFTANEQSCRLKKRDKIKIVGHGIDTDLFLPVPTEDDGVFTILSVGRMSPVKKYEIVIEAVYEVVHILNGLFAFKFVLMAPVMDKQGEQYKEKLIDLVKKYNLAPHFSVSDSSNAGLPAIYNNADLFVHTSETGSVDKVVLEAMACGLPVLTSGEAFDFLPSDYRFEKGNIKNLAEKIIVFSKKGGKQTALREIVKRDFSLNNLFKKIKCEMTN